MSLIVKEADETVNNSVAVQNDDELLFAVAANEVWQFEGLLVVSSNAAADFRLTFVGPTGAVGAWGATAYNSGLATTQSGSGGDLAGEGTHAITGTTDGAYTVFRFWGGIHNGANAGNLTLQWAQGTVNASDTIVHAGSYLKYQIES